MTKLKKELILGSILFILSIFSWWFIKSIFYFGNLTLACWISGIILLIFWGVSLCLSMLLIKDKRILFGSFFISLVSFVFFFNNEPFYYLIVLILLFFSFINASRKIKKQEQIQIKLNYWKIYKSGFSFLITFLIIVISLIYYFSPSLMQIKEFEFSLSRDIFNKVISPLENLIAERLPDGVNLDFNANEFLKEDEILDLKERYGIVVEKTDTGKDVLYNLINFQLNNFSGPYRKFIPFGLAIGLFIFLKITSIIYVITVVSFSSLLTYFLINIKFISKENIKKEVSTIKL
ncbi:hypothetical protein KJ684_00195 [Patescibacteria group bacterium]|nr:hypothetical protein [Patescibacteria group bacterium]